MTTVSLLNSLRAYAATTNTSEAPSVNKASQVSSTANNKPVPKDSLTTLKEKISAPLYDFRDPMVVNAAKSVTPSDLKNNPVEERDLIGAKQIQDDVKAFKAKHPNAEIVVVYSGAGVHSWGAVGGLKKRLYAVSCGTRQPHLTGARALNG